jgi:hypothetical protein
LRGKVLKRLAALDERPLERTVSVDYHDVIAVRESEDFAGASCGAEWLILDDARNGSIASPTSLFSSGPVKPTGMLYAKCVLAASEQHPSSGTTISPVSAAYAGGPLVWTRVTKSSATCS